jgi:hypothetical protein
MKYFKLKIIGLVWVIGMGLIVGRIALDIDKGFVNDTFRRLRIVNFESALIDNISEIPYEVIFNPEHIQNWIIQDIVRKISETAELNVDVQSWVPLLGFIYPVGPYRTKEASSIQQKCEEFIEKLQDSSTDVNSLVQEYDDFLYNIIVYLWKEITSRPLKEETINSIKHEVKTDILTKNVIPEEIQGRLLKPLSEQTLPAVLQNVKDAFTQVVEYKLRLASPYSNIIQTLERLYAVVNSHRPDVADSYVAPLKQGIITAIDELGKSELIGIKYVILSHYREGIVAPRYEGLIPDEGVEKALNLIKEIIHDIDVIFKDQEKKIRKLYEQYFDDELIANLAKNNLGTEQVIGEIETAFTELGELLWWLNDEFLKIWALNE